MSFVLASNSVAWFTGWDLSGNFTSLDLIAATTAALSGAIALSLLLGLAGVTWQWRRAEAESTRLRFQRAEDHFASDSAYQPTA